MPTITLERIWGTSDEDCRGFVHLLYRELYQPDGKGRFSGGGARAGPIEINDRLDVTVDAEDWFEARLLVARAAMAADPAWRRLYRFADPSFVRSA